jgi:hypothetical protein
MGIIIALILIILGCLAARYLYRLKVRSEKREALEKEIDTEKYKIFRLLVKNAQDFFSGNPDLEEEVRFIKRKLVILRNKWKLCDKLTRELSQIEMLQVTSTSGGENTSGKPLWIDYSRKNYLIDETTKIEKEIKEAKEFLEERVEKSLLLTPISRDLRNRLDFQERMEKYISLEFELMPFLDDEEREISRIRMNNLLVDMKSRPLAEKFRPHLQEVALS